MALGRAAHEQIVSVAGFGVDAVTLHQAAFVVWLAVTVPHTLARVVPAWRLATGRPLLSGGLLRATAVAAVIAAGALAAGPVLGEAGEWIHHGRDGDDASAAWFQGPSAEGV